MHYEWAGDGLDTVGSLYGKKEYLELTTGPDFQNKFVYALHFSHMNDTLSYV